MKPGTSGRTPLYALTSLRFFAALAVFNIHFLPLSFTSTLGAWWPTVANLQFSAVSFFFLLSGFIMAYSYADIEPTKDKALNYWAARFARIYPTYFLGMIWFGPFFLAHRFAVEPASVAVGKSVLAFLPASLLIQSWLHPRFAVAWNGPGWSLSVEAVFYVLFPFVAPFFRRNTKRGLLWLALGGITASFVAASAASLALGDGVYPFLFVKYFPVFHIPTFLTGVALGFLFLGRQPTTDRNGDLIALAGLATAAATPTLASWALAQGPLRSHMEALVDNTLFLPAFGLLIYGLAQGGRLARMLEHRFLVLLGEASYSLYILQFSIGMTFALVASGAARHNYWAESGNIIAAGGFREYLLLLAVAVLVSIGVFNWIETPLRIRLKHSLVKWLARRKTDRPARGPGPLVDRRQESA